jgi:GntR family transcriptional regulator
MVAAKQAQPRVCAAFGQGAGVHGAAHPGLLKSMLRNHFKGFFPMALYLQVKRELIAAIQSGRYVPGKALPSESELAQHFGVSVGTIRRAVDELVGDQVLLRQQGRGTFVGPQDRARFMYQFFKLERRDGLREFPQIRLLSFANARAVAEEAQALGISTGARVLRIGNLLSLQGRPVVHDRICVASARFPKLTRERFEQREGTIYDLYQREFGITVVGADERTRAESADPASAALLGLPPNAPVLRVARVALTFERQPAEFRVSIIDTRDHEFLSSASACP